MTQGWINKKLIISLKKYQKQRCKKDIMDLLARWINKLDNFFKQLWKERNAEVIHWEKKNNIDLTEKRKKNRNKKIISERKKRNISGKKFLYYHQVDELFYEKVKEMIGWTFSGFHIVLDKRVYNMVNF